MNHEDLQGRVPQLDHIRIGERFPDLTLPLSDTGQPLSLADYRGQQVMLHLFASW